MFMKTEIPVVKVSLKKVTLDLGLKFGPWLVTKMDHSGIPLYLIRHPEEIEILCGAKPVGLEVNLPKTWLHDIYRGRKKKKVDLIFEKEGSFYLVEIVDKEAPDSRDKKRMKEYLRRFKYIWGDIQAFPIIVCPMESVQEAILSLIQKRKKKS